MQTDICNLYVYCFLVIFFFFNGSILSYKWPDIVGHFNCHLRIFFFIFLTDEIKEGCFFVIGIFFLKEWQNNVDPQKVVRTQFISRYLRNPIWQACNYYFHNFTCKWRILNSVITIFLLYLCSWPLSKVKIKTTNEITF